MFYEIQYPIGDSKILFFEFQYEFSNGFAKIVSKSDMNFWNLTSKGKYPKRTIFIIILVWSWSF